MPSPTPDPHPEASLLTIASTRQTARAAQPIRTGLDQTHNSDIPPDPDIFWSFAT
ncbi:hypothetical protein [Yoonia sp.]|uniref:hypothetical protein n=1 Tax=Yoonia sp. TaxID=2212373 RepID=UPI003975F933